MTNSLREDKLAEQLHEWYLEATAHIKKENYNPNAIKPYKYLNTDQKFIDIFIAKRILALIESLIPEERISTDRMGYTSSEDDGWNACIRAMKEKL